MRTILFAAALLALTSCQMQEAPDPTFNLTIDDSEAKIYQSSIKEAAALVESLINKGLPSATINANETSPGCTAFKGFSKFTTIDDLYIKVVAADASTLEGAVAITNLCFVRQNGVPALATIRINNNMASGNLMGTLTHEIIHALGFMGPNFEGNHLIDGSGSNTPLFNGAQATLKNGGNKPALQPIVQSHWNASFNNDVLVPTVNSTMILSAMTIGALGDLGYDVNYAKAGTALKGSSLSNAAAQIQTASQSEPGLQGGSVTLGNDAPAGPVVRLSR